MYACVYIYIYVCHLFVNFVCVSKSTTVVYISEQHLLFFSLGYKCVENARDIYGIVYTETLRVSHDVLLYV